MKKFLLLFLTVFIVSGCVNPQIGTEEIPVELVIKYPNHTQSFDVNVLENSTVFDLLKSQVELDYTDYPGLGVFINAINNVSNTGENFWMFYVNDTLADVGISGYVINESILIEMRYEKPEW